MRQFFVAIPLLTLFLATVPAAPVPKDTKPQPYFPTGVGAKWVFKSNNGKYAWTVSEVNQKDGATTVVVCFDKDGKIEPVETVRVTEKGLFQTGLGNEQFDPPVCRLRFPPKAGEVWESRARDVIREWRFVFKVLEPEWVEVPAGKFKAFPVVMQLRLVHVFGEDKKPRDDWPLSHREPDVMTDWYAPGVGPVKRKFKGKGAVEDSVDVLESFTPGKE